MDANFAMAQGARSRMHARQVSASARDRMSANFCGRARVSIDDMHTSRIMCFGAAKTRRGQVAGGCVNIWTSGEVRRSYSRRATRDTGTRLSSRARATALLRRRPWCRDRVRARAGGLDVFDEGCQLLHRRLFFDAGPGGSWR